MDTVATSTFMTHVRPAELINAFNQYANDISVLSLDCFDTLIWRHVATPKDLFYDMQNRNLFKSLGITALHRADAELTARRLAFIRKGSYEVSLADIYRIGFPCLDQQQIEALIEEELSAEMETCFVFPPILDLMHHAVLLGKKIIIVSNTYFNEQQLRRLLAKAVPTDLMNKIALIFCSSDYGLSKNDGLFTHVIERLNLSANNILHLGDTQTADYDAPRAYGIHALTLVQYNNKINELFRLQAMAASISDASIRFTRGLQAPFKGVLANTDFLHAKPEKILAYTAMGQVMYAFARYINDEVKQIQKSGKSPKILYLMRDGYLSARASAVLLADETDKPSTYNISISRFSATAASFRTVADIDNYLCHYIHTLSPLMLCKQLLLPDSISNIVIMAANMANNRTYELNRLIHEKSITQHILQRSAEYRARLVTYLRRETGLTAGDTVILVDIGYIGTVQTMLTPILNDELGVTDVTGLYLISLSTHNWQASRRGLIDASWCDDRTMNMFLENIALIEEICSNNEGSVYDYTQDGAIMKDESCISIEQQNKITHIQNECLAFIHAANKFFQSANVTLSSQQLRDAALTGLVRLIHFPFASEVQYLQSFSHEVNRGAKAVLPIYDDLEKEFANVRRQGLLFKDQHPHGLRAMNLEMVITQMTQRRFGFDVYLEDLSLRRENINVIKMHQQQVRRHIFGAMPTQDGFFSLLIPIEQSVTQIGILFGANYQMLQLEHTEIVKHRDILSKPDDNNTTDIWPHLAFHQCLHKGGKLFEFATPDSAIMMTPQLPDNDHYILRVIFRPISKRLHVLPMV